MTPGEVTAWVLGLIGGLTTAIIGSLVSWFKYVEPWLRKRREAKLREHERYVTTEEDVKSREAARQRAAAELESAEKQMNSRHLQKQQQALFKTMTDQLGDLWTKHQEQGNKLLQTSMELARCQADYKSLQTQNVNQQKVITDQEKHIADLTAQIRNLKEARREEGGS